MSLQEWANMLNRASGELRHHIASELVRTAMRAEREAKLRVTNGGFTRLNVRTGRLRASIAGEVRHAPDAIEVVVAAGGDSPNPEQLIRNTTSNPGAVRYARIHEEGGDIRPTRSRYLTVPVHASLFTAGGRQRYASARDVPDLTYGETSAGQPLLVHENSGEVFYLLRRKVSLPARPYLAPAIRTASIAMDEHVFSALRKVLTLRPTGGGV